MSRAHRIAASALAGLVLLQSTALAAEDPACTPLLSLLDAAPGGWRALKTAEYSTQFESWQSRQTLASYESCWIDDVSHRYWCLFRAPSIEAAGKAAAAQAETIERCWPNARTQQAVETGDNNVTRLIQDWALTAERRLRLVHRKPTQGQGLSSVFFYVY